MCAMVCVTGASRWGYTECRSAAGFEVSEPDGTHLYYTMGESEFGRYFITKHREGVNAPGAKRKAGQPASAASVQRMLSITLPDALAAGVEGVPFGSAGGFRLWSGHWDAPAYAP